MRTSTDEKAATHEIPPRHLVEAVERRTAARCRRSADFVTDRGRWSYSPDGGVGGGTDALLAVPFIDLDASDIDTYWKLFDALLCDGSAVGGVELDVQVDADQMPGATIKVVTTL